MNVSKSTISYSAASFPVPTTQKTFTHSLDPLSTNSKHSQPESKMSTMPTLRKHLLCDHTSFLSPPTCLQLQRRWGYLGMLPITIVDSVQFKASTLLTISIAHCKHLKVGPKPPPSIMIRISCLFATMRHTEELRQRHFHTKHSILTREADLSMELHNIPCSTNSIQSTSRALFQTMSCISSF